MKRESFKSRLGFLLVSAGCAIGIGNVWRFPYVAGQNGGGFFVLLYLILSILYMVFAGFLKNRNKMLVPHIHTRRLFYKHEGSHSI